MYNKVWNKSNLQDVSRIYYCVKLNWNIGNYNVEFKKTYKLFHVINWKSGSVFTVVISLWIVIYVSNASIADKAFNRLDWGLNATVLISKH